VEGKQPRNLLIMNEVWSHPPGSNRRPADYESAALPTELGWLDFCFDQATKNHNRK
jgi:hypothetical protein